jgi:hypothetical protein
MKKLIATFCLLSISLTAAADVASKAEIANAQNDSGTCTFDQSKKAILSELQNNYPNWENQIIFIAEEGGENELFLKKSFVDDSYTHYLVIHSVGIYMSLNRVKVHKATCSAILSSVVLSASKIK